MARLGRRIPVGVTYSAAYVEFTATTQVGSGRSDGVATMTASGTITVPSVFFGTGQSDGVATMTVAGAVTMVDSGQSDGVATMTAAGTVTYVASGQSNGIASMTVSPTGVAGAVVPDVLFNRRILPGAMKVRRIPGR